MDGFHRHAFNPTPGTILIRILGSESCGDISALTIRLERFAQLNYWNFQLMRSEIADVEFTRRPTIRNRLRPLLVGARFPWWHRWWTTIPAT